MNHSSTLRCLFIIGALVLLAATLNADTLTLRDGRRVQGELIAFQNGIIEFQEASSYGSRPVRLSRDQVTGIEFGRVNRVEPRYPDTPQQGGRPRGLLGFVRRETDAAGQAVARVGRRLRNRDATV